LFAFLTIRRTSSFEDGLSHTVGLSEKRIGGGNDVSFDRRRDFWFTGVFPLTLRLPPTDELIQLCGGFDGSPGRFYASSGATWLIAGYEQTLYNHSVSPNSPITDCSILLDHPYANMGLFGASSFHRGGVNCLTMDGAVHFVASTTDRKVWRSLATVSGHDISDAPW
jgi:hypothetical protein